MISTAKQSSVLFRVFCLVGIIYILEQFFHQRLDIAAGELLARGFIPHFGGRILVLIEWFCCTIALICMWLGYKRAQASIVVGLIFLFGLLQNFSNHGLLITLAFFYLSHSKHKELLKFQLILMYLLAGTNKVAQSFYNGESLQNLASVMRFQNIEGIVPWPHDFYSLIGTTTIICELLIPVLLLFVPLAGISIALIFHLALALIMPGLWGFFAVVSAYLIAVEYERRNDQILA